MGETLAQPPWAPGGVMAGEVLASLYPSPRKLPPPAHGPAQKLVCLCFLTRDPIMEYCNWERSQKQREGEAERKEGRREEKHGGAEAFGRMQRRFGWIGERGADEGGAQGGAQAGAQVKRREEMCGSQGWATGAGAGKQEGDCWFPRHPGPMWGWHIWGLRGRPRMGQTCGWMLQL